MAAKGITVTPRDKALMIALPSLAVVIGYTLFFAKEPIQRVNALAAKVEATRGQVPSPMALTEAQLRGTQLQQQIQQSENNLVPVKAELSKTTSPGTNNLERLVGNDTLSALWKRNGLILLEQRELEGTAAVLPATLQVLVARSQRLGASRLPNLWEVKIEGTFMQMYSALDELAESDIAAVPIALDMGEAPGNPVKTWRLRIWQ